jgi:periplasmic divalent cation tolerance protein
MDYLCEVVITAPDPGWLYAFARSLVADGLAASAHNFSPIRSVYTWQGQVHERTEGRVSLHTSRARVADIVARAKAEHPYEVPGISARPIIDGNPDYLAWIADTTSAPSDARPRPPMRRLPSAEPGGD